MKKKTFFEPPILYFAFIFLLGTFFLFAWLAWNSIGIRLFSGIFFSLAMMLLGIYIFVSTIWPRTDCIVVADTYAEWRCFLKKKCRVYYDECRYIAVENFNKESHGEIVRGDEFAMIYLSLDPYPEELKGKINRLRCTDRIIKFRYSDKLARAILDRAPQEKTRLLYAFYHQMQSYDMRMERQRKQRKKKRRN